MEKRKVKKDKRKKKSPGNVEKLPGKSDSFYSSEDIRVARLIAAWMVEVIIFQ